MFALRQACPEPFALRQAQCERSKGSGRTVKHLILTYRCPFGVSLSNHEQTYGTVSRWGRTRAGVKRNFSKIPRAIVKPGMAGWQASLPPARGNVIISKSRGKKRGTPSRALKNLFLLKEKRKSGVFCWKFLFTKWLCWNVNHELNWNRHTFKHFRWELLWT